MTKFGRVFKWRKKMIEEKIFDEQGFIKVDPTIPNFFENVFKIDLDIESVKEFKENAMRLAEEQDVLTPFWRPTLNWERTKKTFFPNYVERPHSYEWWMQQVENIDWKFVHKVDIGYEFQYQLFCIWLINYWVEKRQLEVNDAVILLCGGEPYGEKITDREKAALIIEKPTDSILLKDSDGEGFYFAGVVTPSYKEARSILLNTIQILYEIRTNDQWQNVKPWLVFEFK